MKEGVCMCKWRMEVASVKLGLPRRWKYVCEPTGIVTGETVLYLCNDKNMNVICDAT